MIRIMIYGKPTRTLRSFSLVIYGEEQKWEMIIRPGRGRPRGKRMEVTREMNPKYDAAWTEHIRVRAHAADKRTR